MEQTLDQNYRDMICLLNEENVEYLLVDGWAISYHAAFRYTEDIDLWVRPTPDNAQRLIRALDRFGAPRAGLTAEDFAQPRWGLHIGVIGRDDLIRNKLHVARDKDLRDVVALRKTDTKP